VRKKLEEERRRNEIGLEMVVVEGTQDANQEFENPLVRDVVRGDRVHHFHDGVASVYALIGRAHDLIVLTVLHVTSDEQVASTLHEIDVHVGERFEGTAEATGGLSNSLGEGAYLAVISRPEHRDSVRLS
jgi:hypothetical protein